MDTKLVYLVVGKCGITVCESFEIAEEIWNDNVIYDPSVSIQQKVLLTKEIY